MSGSIRQISAKAGAFRKKNSGCFCHWIQAIKNYLSLKTGLKIVAGLAIVVLDVGVYILFGLMLMNYDDFYDESKGEYWSFESMTPFDKGALIGLHLWHAVNLLAVGCLLYWLIKKWKIKTAGAKEKR